MAYNSIVSQSGSNGIAPNAPSAAPLIPLEYSQEIINLMPASSVALQSFRKINMGHAALQVPVLDAIGAAYWVNNNGTAAPGTAGSAGTYSGLIQTTSQAWKGVQLVAQELAVIVPVPNTLLQDSMFPVWDEITPIVASEMARALDSAVFFGLNSPFTAPALVPAALAAGNVYTLGTAAQDDGGLANDISQAFSLVEYNSGFNVNGLVASKSLKVRIRNARDTLGQPLRDIDVDDVFDVTPNFADSMGGLWPTSASWTGSTTSGSPNVTLASGSATQANEGDVITGTGIPTGTTIQSVTDSTHVVLDQNASATGSSVAFTLVAPDAVLGDFSQAIIGERQDLQYQILNEAVIQDASGNVVLNLAQQNAQALRVTARYGFAVANSVTWYNQNDATRFPFAVLIG